MNFVQLYFHFFVLPFKYNRLITFQNSFESDAKFLSPIVRVSNEIDRTENFTADCQTMVNLRNNRNVSSDFISDY